MSFADFFYALGDGFYWLFETTLEPTGELFWKVVMFGGFGGFLYWMYRQAKYNKMAKNNPNQIK
ncbi:MAG: hypothetical protein IPM74_14705 [Crocinitomicaceae bacterium]|nr:hypothetical protein [Crocinitomicaceae bacterium]MBK8927121.1 hypothetical protein [Crocinitomicaceae bacterium]